jgi:hypothetical protein
MKKIAQLAERFMLNEAYKIKDFASYKEREKVVKMIRSAIGTSKVSEDDNDWTLYFKPDTTQEEWQKGFDKIVSQIGRPDDVVHGFYYWKLGLPKDAGSIVSMNKWAENSNNYVIVDKSIPIPSLVKPKGAVSVSWDVVGGKGRTIMKNVQKGT